MIGSGHDPVIRGAGSAPASVALIFPGQGSQSVGMGKAVHDAFPEARSIFERVDRRLGVPLSRTCFDGPEEELRLTATTQPAILTTSMAVLAALLARSSTLPSRIVCMAGHSLGEYSALVAAGVIDLEDAVGIVRQRGQYMQEAVPAGQGAMAAVLGANLDTVEAVCRDAAEGDVLSPANLNAPDQTVVSGSASAVERLAGLARSRGIRKVMRLPVSAPFHCDLMVPAQERLAGPLDGLTLRDASVPIITNVDAEPETRADRLRDALKRQVTAPVRWVETIGRIRALGATHVVEVGPGRVLCGLAKRNDPGLRCVSVEDPAGLEAALEVLAGSAVGGK
jgi:[acyl-carrier-protein] S-malonyltransferase